MTASQSIHYTSGNALSAVFKCLKILQFCLLNFLENHVALSFVLMHVHVQASVMITSDKRWKSFEFCPMYAKWFPIFLRTWESVATLLIRMNKFTTNSLYSIKYRIKYSIFLLWYMDVVFIVHFKLEIVNGIDLFM